MFKKLLHIGRDKVIRFILGHKVQLLLLAIIIYLVMPKALPRISGLLPSETTLSGAGADSFDPKFLYDPAADGADTKLSMPVELTDAQLQKTIQEVDALGELQTQMFSLNEQYDKAMTVVNDSRLTDMMWPRLHGQGFKDKKLSADWYAMTKIGTSMPGTVGEMAADGLQLPFVIRLREMRPHLIAGKVLKGDMLFLKTYRGILESRIAHCKKLVPVASNVASRLKKEFPDLKANPRTALFLRRTQIEMTGTRIFLHGLNPVDLGMSTTDLTNLMVPADFDQEKIGDNLHFIIRADHLRKVGPYPLTTLEAYFYQDKLYEIKMTFNENRQEIYALFNGRYTPLDDNDEAPPGTTVKDARDSADGSYGVIFAVGVDKKNEPNWNEIEIEDWSLWQKAQLSQSQP